MNLKANAVYMSGMGVGLLIFILEVADGVQARNKIRKKQRQLGMWSRFVLPKRERKETRTADK